MLTESALTLSAPCGCRGASMGRGTLTKHVCDYPQPMPAPNPATGEQLRCGRCGALMRDVEWIEVSAFGDREPSYLPGRARCSTPRCGQVCPICRREPGDIHSGACSPFVLSKLVDPCRVSREDCRRVPA